MTDHDRARLADEFSAYCEQQGIHLTDLQRHAARVLLDAIASHAYGARLFSSGRGGGKTFLLDRIDEFVSVRDVPRRQPQDRA